MRNQAYSLMSLASFAAIAAAGFIGACGGKVVVDGGNPDGSGGAGGAGGSFAITGSTVGVVTTGVVGTTSSPSSSGATMDVSVSVGSGMGGSFAVASSVGSGMGGSFAVASSVSSGPMSSAVSSTGVAASSSTGVVDSCNNACNKAQMCGLDFCGQFGVNCASVPPQTQCGLDCISNGSCGDIAKLAMQNFATPLGACLLGCQGMGPGGVGSSGVGSTGSGPPPMACQQCTFQKCGQPIFQCNAKKGAGSCSKWLQCAQGCGQDSMCLFGCDAQFPNAAPEYDAVYSCLCSKCDAQCAGEDACGHTRPIPPAP